MKHFFTSCYLDSPFQTGRIFDMFEPETDIRDTALFFVHGGGWHAGSRVGKHKLMEAFSARGYLCASTDYRLSGVTVFEQLQDVREAYDRLVTVLKQKNRPVKIAVQGESAGAHLASLLLCCNPGECGEQCRLENEWVKPCCGILQSTPTDFLPHEWMMPRSWANKLAVAGAPYEKDPERYERLSLKNYIRPDNPPLFFMEAELEHLYLPECTLEFVKKHRSWGIPSQWKVYTRMEHGFFFDLVRKAQREAFEDFCDFVEGKLQTI